MALNIVFMGTPAFAVAAFETIIKAGHKIISAYTMPPKFAGRGMELRKSDIHLAAEKHGIPVYNPTSLKSDEAAAEFKGLNADIAVVAAYGLLLPKAILEIPRYGCINIHPSLLPRWRGAAPIQRTVMAGDAETGVCIMQMDERLDAGSIILMRKIPIDDEETSKTLHDRLSLLGASLLVDALAKIENATAEYTPQSENGITYAKKIEKAEAKLDFCVYTAVELECIIRGLNPYPGAYFEYNGERIKVLLAEVVDVTGYPGTVLDDKLTIACSKKSLRPRLLQRSGREPLTAMEVLNGLKIPTGTVLQHYEIP